MLDIRPGPEGSAPTDLLAGNGFLWFAADDGIHGRELWRTDGTPAGTSMVDVIPGPSGIAPSGLARLDDSSLVAFQGDSGPDGAEPWVSDGTIGGTFQVADLRPGIAGSFPRFGAVAGHDWLFVADDGVVGAELWRLPVASLEGTLARNFGQPCFHPGGHRTSIAARGVPRLGNASFAFELHGAEPTTFAGLLVGFGAADLPLPAGCRLWVRDPVLLVSFTNGAGSTSVGLSIPADPIYLGTPVAGQFLALDPPAGPAEFALTDGLSVLVGN
jgi:ELWxxDGT repeat protein